MNQLADNLWSMKPARYAAARLAIDLGLFEKLADDQGRAKSSTELATMAGADPRLAGMLFPIDSSDYSGSSLRDV